MTAPSDYSSLAGIVEVWARMLVGEFNPAGQWQAQPDWDVRDIKIGSNDRISTATVVYNRDKVLRDDQYAEPPLYQDVLFCASYREDGQAVPTVLFEGSPSVITRNISGVPGASHDTGEVSLQSSTVLWADHPSSQIIGRYLPRLRALDGTGTMVNDQATPCAFNAGGKPNRSIKTAESVQHDGINLFADDDQLDSYYFTPDDGWDIWSEPDTGGEDQLRTRKARYWTYAQAIAYVLHRYCYSVGTPSAAVKRNEVRLWFGAPPGTTPVNQQDDRRYPDTNTPWGAVHGQDRQSPIYKLEAYGERYEGDTSPPPTDVGFNPSPIRLLSTKVNNLSIEGMNAIEALLVLFRAAGLGMWFDHFTRFTSYNAPPPDTIETVVRCWSPGGVLAVAEDGIGEVKKPMLEPHGTSAYAGFAVPRTASDIFSKNTVETLSSSLDMAQVINSPTIVRSPTLVEITAKLRPGWRPLHHKDFGFLDNVDALASVIDGTGNAQVTTNERDAAIADAIGTFLGWTNNPEQAQLALPSGPLTRRKAMSKRLHAKGESSHKFYDIGRKWIIPTDHSYPDETFAREDLAAMPWFWKTYLPADFGHVAPNQQSDEHWIVEAIPGAESWPTIRREFLPCLVADASGQSIGIVCEISFDAGTTWVPHTSFRVATDELAIWLTYENPFDVQNPTLRGPTGGSLSDYTQRGNLWLAYIHNNFRVRITATIAVSGLASTSIANHTAESTRSRVFDRRQRFGKTELRSQYKTRVTDKLIDLAAYNGQANDAESKLFYYRVRNDSTAVAGDGSKLQALLGMYAASGTWVTPWFETDIRPGHIISHLEESAAGGLKRKIDFRTTAGTYTMAPHVAGVIWSFATGGMRTQYVLDDWRALSESRGA